MGIKCILGSAKAGPSEAEACRMAAVLNASYPEGYQFRVYWGHSPLSGYVAVAAVERFNGCTWLTAKPMASEWASDREGAFRSLLGNWSRRESWAEESRGVRLPWPPAASTAELCLKLEMLEAAG